MAIIKRNAQKITDKETNFNLWICFFDFFELILISVS